MALDRRIILEGAVLEGEKILGAAHELLFTHVISVVFYSGPEKLSSQVVDKATMAGTLTFAASETGDEYTNMDDPTITLGITDYERPTAQGGYVSFRMTMNSVVGATHWKVCIASTGGV